MFQGPTPLEVAISRRRRILFGGNGDPEFASVQWVSNFNGVDAETTTDDGSNAARTVVFNGNAQLDDAQQKFGTTSLLLDGTGDSVHVVSDSALNVGTGDFTIEGWIRYNGDPGTSPRTLAAKWTETGNQREWILQSQDNTINFWLSTDGSNAANYGGGAFDPAADTWYHLAVVRDGTTIRTFAHGVQIDTSPIAVETELHTGTSPLYVGQSDGGFPNYHNGWIDDFRFTVGVARYTATFDPDDLTEWPTS